MTKPPSQGKIHTARKQINLTETETNGLSQNFIAQTETARGYCLADHLKLHKLKDNRQLIFLARFQIQSYWSMILRRHLLTQELSDR